MVNIRICAAACAFFLTFAAAARIIFLKFKEKGRAMTPQQQTINGFLVDVFHDVLRLEERNLRDGTGGLSLTELHVLEAVHGVSEMRGGTMADVAAALGVTSGTLTIAVKTLEAKGYVRRERDGEDRRRVLVRLTDKAQPALRRHAEFLCALVTGATERLSDEELRALTKALDSLRGFFDSL